MIENKKLNEDRQEILINFLLNILKDTKTIQVKCDCHHQDLYYDLMDNFDDLNLFSIKEDWDSDNPVYWNVEIEFLYPLRDLIGLNLYFIKGVE